MLPLILGISGPSLTEEERQLFRATPPFGIILFLRNVESRTQLAELINEIAEIGEGQILLFIDQEGGRVQRLAPPDWPQYPIAGDLQTPDDEQFEAAIYALHRLIGDDLAQARIDVNCAPCLDLATPSTAEFLRERCFGIDIKRVIRAGRAGCQGLLDAGVEPVIKHLPGHGRASMDSHLDLPQVEFDTDPYASLPPPDIAIFQADYPGISMAMTAHILYGQIDPDYPLTISHKGIDFIRNIVGFKGVLLSDDIAMKALTGRPELLAARTLQCGVDLVLACSGEIEDIKALASVDYALSDGAKTLHQKIIAKRQSKPAALGKKERERLFETLERADMSKSSDHGQKHQGAKAVTGVECDE